MRTHPLNQLVFVVAAIVCVTAPRFLASQTLVHLPRAAAVHELAGATAVAGIGMNIRQLIAVDAAHFSSSMTGRQITGLAFRRDEAAAREFAGGAVTMTVKLGSLGVSANGVHRVFDDNWDASAPAPVVVFSGTVTVPTSPELDGRASGWGEASDVVQIPFSVPFTHTGGALGIELLGFAGVGQEPLWYVDAAYEAADGQVVASGAGCGSTDSLTLGAQTLVPGQTAKFSVYSAPAAIAVLMIGSLTPPIPLQIVGGAPGCTLQVAPIAQIPTVVEPLMPEHVRDGLAVVPLEIPTGASSFGASLSAQFATLGAALETSESVTFTIATAAPSLGMSHVWARYEGQAVPTAGEAQINLAPVVRLTLAP